MKITLILITYSFGTFGLLNLFDLRLAVQAVVIAFVIIILLMLKRSYRAIDMVFVMLFALLIGFGGIVHGGQISSPVHALLMIFIIITIMGSPDRHILGLAKALVICSALFCVLVFIALIGYSLYPNQIQHANFNIYDSTTGHQHISPGSVFDWFSFTSGDGFAAGENDRIRLKGYSNEPSSTIVHYLAPVSLAFFLAGRYIYVGVFIIAINIVAISSLMSIFIIIGSLIAMPMICIFRRYFRFVFAIALVLISAVLMLPEFILSTFATAGAFAIDYFSIDLISRKVGEGSDDASILLRLRGIDDGMKLLFVSPVGYSYELLGPGAGLIYIISATSGWIGLVIFLLFIMRFFGKVLKGIELSQTYSNQYALALTISLLIVMLLISGYGWDRPPWIIIIFLLYRMIDMRINDSISTGNH